ncbi:hypothetical protein [Desulfogranum marinum]|uniref:hypothetical protein n=1 Tax=Desulfogranum marinum TaxID=453220 RepID=UPI001963CD51|nr:hypothetical protein [Desulfogranum marinum]MBM9515229.1 hypothetical protein [Desulfogranum marinum]
MAIHQGNSIFHWNYFIALESDLANLSRFVEFNTGNFRTFSIEIARLLQSACSEIDILAYQLCAHMEPGERVNRIDQYRPILRPGMPDLESTVVEIPRFGLTLTPWANWQSDNTPNWWTDHNKVKHRRSEHFEKANLKNLLNASAGLLLLIVCFYRLTTDIRLLDPPPQLFKLNREFVPVELILGCGAALVLREK